MQVTACGSLFSITEQLVSEHFFRNFVTMGALILSPPNENYQLIQVSTRGDSMLETNL